MTERRVKHLEWSQATHAGNPVSLWVAYCPALGKRFYAENKSRIPKVEAMRAKQVLSAWDRLEPWIDAPQGLPLNGGGE